MKWYQMQWAQKYWGKEARERYRRYLQSDAWKAKRKSVLQAAGFRCRRCGKRATEVHHETYKRMSDLTALCSKCHEAAHTRTPKSRKKAPLRKSTGIENLNNADFIKNAKRQEKTRATRDRLYNPKKAVLSIRNYVRDNRNVQRKYY